MPCGAVEGAVWIKYWAIKAQRQHSAGRILVTCPRTCARYHLIDVKTKERSRTFGHRARTLP